MNFNNPCRLLNQVRAAVDTLPRRLSEAVNPRSTGGPNDFSSEGECWWPDPENLTGPFIRRDGVSISESFSTYHKMFIAMARDVAALAAAWQITGKRRFLEAVCAHLRVWFVELDARMNPHLQCAQAIPGRCTGRDIGIIDSVHLCEVAVALRLLERDLPTAFPSAFPNSGWIVFMNNANFR